MKAGRKGPKLQFHGHQAPQWTAEEQQVESILLGADCHTFLAGDEGETVADFHQEGPEVVEDGGLKVLLQVGVVQAEHVQEDRVGERVARNG